MKVFFLSSRQAALTLNGVYLGMIDGFERSVQLNPDDGIYAQIAPLSCIPLRFCIDQDFLFAPPPNINLYYSDDEVAVYAFGFTREDQTLKVLSQERLGAAHFTLYRQGEIYLRYENGRTHVVPLSDEFERCKIEEVQDGYLLTGSGAFLLLGRDGKVLVQSEGEVLQASNPLTVEIPFHDAMGHSVVSEWKNGRLVATSVRAKRTPSEATYALALLESVKVGVDPAPYLHEKIRHKADALKEFLGDYHSVVLSTPQRIGLVYQRRERVFDVRYFTITLEDGKISNISPEE